MLAKSISGAAAAVEPAFVEDVFSNYLYTGNGSTQTITNGIDLAGEGGMVWIKDRSAAIDHIVFDTVRGATKGINTNLTDAQGNYTNALTAFTSSGFSLGSPSTYVNTNGDTYASWTFRKQPKFFDVVTYTGTGSNLTVNHNLGSAPGCIIIKDTSNAYNWTVYHRSLATGEYLVLNSTGAKVSTGGDNVIWNVNSTSFNVASYYGLSYSGDGYVAYLFAHDAGGFGLTGTDNVISCGSFTTAAYDAGLTYNATVNLGFEPQFILCKQSDGVDNWKMADNMRGMPVSSNSANLAANTSGAESSNIQFFSPSATGFSTVQAAFNSSSTYIYIAIRRGPMKVPTSGTSVFQPVVYTGTNVDNRLVDMNLLTDMVFVRQRDDTVLGGMVVGDRLRGDPYLLTGTTAAEVSDADSFMTPTSGVGNSWSAMNGFGVGNDATSKLNASTTSNNQIAEGFRRAPGFFDVVCYTGNGTNLAINHNLQAVPELIILKYRAGTSYGWKVTATGLTNPNTYYLDLNGTNAESNYTANFIYNRTSTTFTVVSDLAQSGWNWVAYLFATCAGVSKVGSYTGTGTTQQINCGFTGGARFVLIKRTDSTGDWYVWDSARGIVAGNDPYLLLNSTAAEVTNTDYIDTYSAGFEISSTAPADINANGGTYIFLAVA